MIKHSTKKSLFREILAIIGLSIVLGLIYNSFSPKGISLIRTELQRIGIDDSELFAENKAKKDANNRIITLDQLKRLSDQRRGIIIDARTKEEYQAGHIPGARSIPYRDLELHIEELIEIPKDTLIVIYCNNPECPLGFLVADFLRQMEFRNLLIYDEGWDKWVKAGLPIEQNKVD